MSKEYRSLEKIVQSYEAYKKLLGDLDFNREALMGDDEELRELAKLETDDLEERKNDMESYIRQLLIPKDPQDERMPLLRSAPEPGATKPAFLQVTWLACT
jgi:peptide chain release factor 1